jgi:RNA polymerase sigma-70 factor (ECF subfamily)
MADESAAPSNDELTAPNREDSIRPERIRAGDPGALRAVVSAYLGQVLRAARGAGLTPEQAEDVTQATFTTFMERAPQFEGRSHVRTWLFGILYKKIAEKRRARDRDRQLDDIDQVFEARFDHGGAWAQPPRPPDADMEDQEIGGAISECLDAAPTQQRMAFVLREVEDLSTKEICKILDVTVTNLGVILYRIRNRLRECLEAKGIDPLRN